MNRPMALHRLAAQRRRWAMREPLVGRLGELDGGFAALISSSTPGPWSDLATRVVP
jgi:hypothetical protein